MKRSIKVLALLIVSVLALVAFAGCGGLPKTPNDAKANLEKKGYEVMVADAEDLGYIAAMFGLEEGDLTGAVMAVKESTKDEVSILYCKNEAVADKLWNDSNFMTAFPVPDKGMRKQVNNILCVGTKQGVKDAG